jgi:hypothetical protein
MPTLYDNKSINYKHIAFPVRTSVIRARSAGPEPESHSLKLTGNVPTITLPRYHIAANLRKEKAHAAHFPISRDQPGQEFK